MTLKYNIDTISRMFKSFFRTRIKGDYILIVISFAIIGNNII